MRIERSTELAASPEDVWRHATSMQGVNRELSTVSMSHPAGRVHLSDHPPLGEPAFTSTSGSGPSRLTGTASGSWRGTPVSASPRTPRARSIVGGATAGRITSS